MGGKGGRMPNNEIRKMQGMNLASLWLFTAGGLLLKQPISTGPRLRTSGTTWATTRTGNSNGSTLLARTTSRLLPIEWPGGSLTTGRSDFNTRQFIYSLKD